MGALHAGHLALIERARASGGSVVASVFVNPLQFVEGEDFARYPRDLDADRQVLERAGVALVFAPERHAMYPPGFSTTVEPGPMGDAFEGALRPGHFRGVATVVVKLVQLAHPDALYLGQKDAQQCAVLRHVMRDLDVPVRVEIVGTVREPDGLALSSRNAYLDARERAAAPTLHASLVAMREALDRGASKRDAVTLARETLAPAATADYYDLVDAETFAPLERLAPDAFVIGAARFGSTRLIDNLWVHA
jgi:pantoate--beta-alanine ligase